MSNSLLVFIFLIIVASLFQVSVLPIPFGILVLLTWFFTKGTEHFVLLALVFAVSLAAVSALPAFAILLSVSVSLGVLVIGRQFFPPNRPATVLLVLVAVGIWEISLFALQKFVV